MIETFLYGCLVGAPLGALYAVTHISWHRSQWRQRYKEEKHWRKNQ